MTSKVPHAERIRELAEILSTCPKVRKFDSPDEPEAWSLAHALADMDESMTKISRELIPKLNGVEGSDAEDVLYDIGEELRHIHYHLADSRFFRYLVESNSHRQ